MTRILFVDDEPMILKALEAGFRKHRHRWTMEFVVGGARALEAIAGCSFDIVITDLRMPDVDGLAVLRHLQEHHPETVRIVLSGGAERKAALAAMALAHQSLGKPYRSADFEAVLERACALRVLVGDPALRRAVGRLRDLPPLPLTYERLTRVLANERAGFRDVVAVIAADIAVSTRVLKLANSAIFGIGRAVSTVADAVPLLGTETIKGVVLAIALFEGPSLAPAARVFATELHEHSLLVAEIASELADAPHRSDAFTAGMLHDVGSMILAAQPPTPEIANEASDHAKVGAYLLALWGLPPSIIDGVALHHEERADGSVVASAIYRAEQIADEVAGERAPTRPEVDEMRRLARERASVPYRGVS